MNFLIDSDGSSELELPELRDDSDFGHLAKYVRRNERRPERRPERLFAVPPAATTAVPSAAAAAVPSAAVAVATTSTATNAARLPASTKQFEIRLARKTILPKRAAAAAAAAPVPAGMAAPPAAATADDFARPEQLPRARSRRSLLPEYDDPPAAGSGGRELAEQTMNLTNFDFNGPQSHSTPYNGAAPRLAAAGIRFPPPQPAQPAPEAAAAASAAKSALPSNISININLNSPSKAPGVDKENGSKPATPRRRRSQLPVPVFSPLPENPLGVSQHMSPHNVQQLASQNSPLAAPLSSSLVAPATQKPDSHQRSLVAAAAAAGSAGHVGEVAFAVPVTPRRSQTMLPPREPTTSGNQSQRPAAPASPHPTTPRPTPQKQSLAAQRLRLAIDAAGGSPSRVAPSPSLSPRVRAEFLRLLRQKCAEKERLAAAEEAGRRAHNRSAVAASLTPAKPDGVAQREDGTQHQITLNVVVDNATGRPPSAAGQQPHREAAIAQAADSTPPTPVETISRGSAELAASAATSSDQRSPSSQLPAMVYDMSAYMRNVREDEIIRDFSPATSQTLHANLLNRERSTLVEKLPTGPPKWSQKMKLPTKNAGALEIQQLESTVHSVRSSGSASGRISHRRLYSKGDSLEALEPPADDRRASQPKRVTRQSDEAKRQSGRNNQPSTTTTAEDSSTPQRRPSKRRSAEMVAAHAEPIFKEPLPVVKRAKQRTAAQSSKQATSLGARQSVLSNSRRADDSLLTADEDEPASHQQEPTDRRPRSSLESSEDQLQQPRAKRRRHRTKSARQADERQHLDRLAEENRIRSEQLEQLQRFEKEAKERQRQLKRLRLNRREQQQQRRRSPSSSSDEDILSSLHELSQQQFNQSQSSLASQTVARSKVASPTLTSQDYTPNQERGADADENSPATTKPGPLSRRDKPAKSAREESLKPNPSVRSRIPQPSNKQKQMQKQPVRPRTAEEDVGADVADGDQQLSDNEMMREESQYEQRNNQTDKRSSEHQEHSERTIPGPKKMPASAAIPSSESEEEEQIVTESIQAPAPISPFEENEEERSVFQKTARSKRTVPEPKKKSIIAPKPRSESEEEGDETQESPVVQKPTRSKRTVPDPKKKPVTAAIPRSESEDEEDETEKSPVTQKQSRSQRTVPEPKKNPVPAPKPHSEPEEEGDETKESPIVQKQTRSKRTAPEPLKKPVPAPILPSESEEEEDEAESAPVIQKQTRSKRTVPEPKKQPVPAPNPPSEPEEEGDESAVVQKQTRSKRTVAEPKPVTAPEASESDDGDEQARVSPIAQKPVRSKRAASRPKKKPVPAPVPASDSEFEGEQNRKSPDAKKPTRSKRTAPKPIQQSETVDEVQQANKSPIVEKQTKTKRRTLSVPSSGSENETFLSCESEKAEAPADHRQPSRKTIHHPRQSPPPSADGEIDTNHAPPQPIPSAKPLKSALKVSRLKSVRTTRPGRDSTDVESFHIPPRRRQTQFARRTADSEHDESIESIAADGQQQRTTYEEAEMNETVPETQPAAAEAEEEDADGTDDDEAASDASSSTSRRASSANAGARTVYELEDMNVTVPETQAMSPTVGGVDEGDETDANIQLRVEGSETSNSPSAEISVATSRRSSVAVRLDYSECSEASSQRSARLSTQHSAQLSPVQEQSQISTRSVSQRDERSVERSGSDSSSDGNDDHAAGMNSADDYAVDDNDEAEQVTTGSSRQTRTQAVAKKAPVPAKEKRPKVAAKVAKSKGPKAGKRQAAAAAATTSRANGDAADSVDQGSVTGAKRKRRRKRIVPTMNWEDYHPYDRDAAAMDDNAAVRRSSRAQHPRRKYWTNDGQPWSPLVVPYYASSRKQSSRLAGTSAATNASSLSSTAAAAARSARMGRRAAATMTSSCTSTMDDHASTAMTSVASTSTQFSLNGMLMDMYNGTFVSNKNSMESETVQLGGGVFIASADNLEYFERDGVEYWHYPPQHPHNSRGYMKFPAHTQKKRCRTTEELEINVLFGVLSVTVDSSPEANFKPGDMLSIAAGIRYKLRNRNDDPVLAFFGKQVAPANIADT